MLRRAILLAALAALPACRTRSRAVARLGFEAPEGATSDQMREAKRIVERRLEAEGIEAEVLVEGRALTIALRRGSPLVVRHLLKPVGRLDFVPFAVEPPFAEAFRAAGRANGLEVSEYGLYVHGTPGDSQFLPRVTALLEAATGADARYSVGLQTRADRLVASILDWRLAMAHVPVESAELQANPASRDPQILVRLAPKAADSFADLTARFKGQQLAILVDGTLVTAPIVQESITGGSLVISLGLELQTDPGAVRSLALALGSGELPFPLAFVRETAGSP